LEALKEAGTAPASLLDRHVNKDWGDLSDEDKQENEFSLVHGFRLLSCYTLSTGVRLWCITEADRSSTCILLPSEY
jgi:hypothetical protein